MDNYEKAVKLWQNREISSDAKLAESMNGHSIAFAYNSGKIENDKIHTTTPAKFSSMTVLLHIRAICVLCLKSAMLKMQMSCSSQHLARSCPWMSIL